jgi:acyl-CoA reductase-like NAD-dependent aldehyde dehydrogenase
MKEVEKIEAHIADALKKGTKIVNGSERATQGGNFFEPNGADRYGDRHGHH